MHQVFKVPKLISLGYVSSNIRGIFVAKKYTWQEN